MAKRKLYKKRLVENNKKLRHLECPVTRVVKVKKHYEPQTILNGYIRVRALTDKDGNVCGFSKVKDNNHSNNSVCLFIAGGVEIDQKVAKANAALFY